MKQTTLVFVLLSIVMAAVLTEAHDHMRNGFQKGVKNMKDDMAELKGLADKITPLANKVHKELDKKGTVLLGLLKTVLGLLTDHLPDLPKKKEAAPAYTYPAAESYPSYRR